jgi:ribosomal-protein-alanine N-acetyltransferase
MRKPVLEKAKITLREPLLSDAKRYVEILSHPEFIYFPAKPASVRAEKEFLRKSKQLRKEGTLYDFAVLADGKHVAAAGIRIIPHQPHICNIGYFVDRAFWNKGIATRAVECLEAFIDKALPGIVRIEIIAAKDNIASQKVAVKSGYKKEGLMKKYMKIGDTFHDCVLYAKIVK